MKIINEFVKIIDDVPVKVLTIKIHEFLVSDVDDPVVYAAEPLLQWEKSESGKFVMNNAVEKPEWRQWLDPLSYGTRFCIIAKLTEKDANYFALKYL